MTKADIINSVSRKFHNIGFQLKKHSPEILIATGVIGTVASTVMACKATLKVNKVIEEAKSNVDRIHIAVEKGKTEAGEDYTKEDCKKDTTIVYAHTGLKLVKLYAPAVILGAASVGCILTSHNIVRKRNVALAAAYASVDRGFKEYRGRVVERFGKELDRELKYDIKAKEVEETVTNEDGTKTTIKKTAEVAHAEIMASPYARFYDDGCNGWTKNPEMNLMFLRQQEEWANQKLKAKGHLFLNEVYDMLGIDRSQYGQYAGWVIDETDPYNENYVDFGIYNGHLEGCRDFVNGRERTILLDFNVTGNILDRLA